MPNKHHRGAGKTTQGINFKLITPLIQISTHATMLLTPLRRQGRQTLMHPCMVALIHFRSSALLSESVVGDFNCDTGFLSIHSLFPFCPPVTQRRSHQTTIVALLTWQCVTGAPITMGDEAQVVVSGWLWVWLSVFYFQYDNSTSEQCWPICLGFVKRMGKVTSEIWERDQL